MIRPQATTRARTPLAARAVTSDNVVASSIGGASKPDVLRVPAAPAAPVGVAGSAAGGVDIHQDEGDDQPGECATQ